MITKKTIRKQIEKLEEDIQWYNGHINRLCDVAKKLGFIVYKDDYGVTVYCENGIRAGFIMSVLDRTKGKIIGLQEAIEQLNNLL